MTDIPTDLHPLILQGNVLQVLHTLPHNSVHCSVFSPPFWSLRDYAVCGCAQDYKREVDVEHPLPRKATTSIHRKRPDPNCQWCHGTGMIPGLDTMWGLGFMPCNHEWEATPPRRSRKSTDVVNPESISAGNRGAAYDARGGKFCKRCGAWFGSLGLEPTPQLYVDHMVEFFRALRPVLRDDALTLMEIGDTYLTDSPVRSSAAEAFSDTWDPAQTASRGGSRRSAAKIGNIRAGNLAFIPHRVAMALQEDGWIVRQDNVGVWDRPNPMPESTRNRSTRSHSYIFQIIKEPGYYWDRENARQAQTGNAHPRGAGKMKKGAEPGSGIKVNPSFYAATNDILPPEAGRNLVSVWRIPTQAYPGKHYATYPTEIPRRCIAIGTSDRGCCPECGAPFERVTSLGDPDREWQQSSGGNARGEYRGMSKKSLGGTGAQNPSDVKRRVLDGMVPKITIGWRPRCDCFPDPCDKCGTPWVHRTALKRVSKMNIRVRDAKKGILGGKSGLGGDAADATEEEIDDYDTEEGTKVIEVDVSWPGCSCRPLVAPVVLDPFAGSGTTPLVARIMYRRSIAIELSPYYIDMITRRLAEETGGLAPTYVHQRKLTELPTVA